MNRRLLGRVCPSSPSTPSQPGRTRAPRLRPVLALAAVSAALAGCGASAPVHYYTLQGPSAPAPPT